MNRIFSVGILVLSGVCLLTACASYNAMALGNLSVVQTQGQTEDGVVVVAKAFNKVDCKRYLDRDVLAEGYQPIQICIQNDSDKNYLFTPDRISLPCASMEEVAARVYTSTAGRIVGYGVFGVLFCWPLIIPAVVDGVKSSQANKALDIDFAAKVAHNQTILSHSRLNKIIFVPLREYQSSFSVTLVDAETGTPKNVRIAV